MTKKELLLKLKEDLKGFQVGLHSVNLHIFQLISGDYSFKRAHMYQFEGEKTEETIVENILKCGLNVRETGIGIISTVKFFDEIGEDTLDYNYYDRNDSNKVCNLIVSIPYFVKHNGNFHFVGKLPNLVSIGNLILFNYNLPREFIYGYYTKSLSECGDSEFTLYENPNYWTKNSLNEQEEVLKKIFKERKWSKSSLELANNDKKFILLFHPRKHLIRATREQKKLKHINSTNK